MYQLLILKDAAAVNIVRTSYVVVSTSPRVRMYSRHTS